MFTIKLSVLVFGTIGILWISRSALQDVQNHGFYRFFSWESILILFVLNVNYWIIDPFSVRQILSWIFLIISLLLIFQGVRMFRRKGEIDENRNHPALVGIEKTTQLVTTGIYRYIRHPFYSSLLFLGWGIFLKNISWVGLILAAANTIFLVLTAQKEEHENIQYFGEAYQAYRKNTKMFIPYVF